MKSWHSSLGSLFLVTPENRLDSQLVHRLNHDTNIVTQYLTEYFVDLRYLFLAHQSRPELLFDHRERCLDVAPLVVVPPKPLLIVSVKVVHPGPERIVTLVFRLRVNFERGAKDTLKGASCKDASLCRTFALCLTPACYPALKIQWQLGDHFTEKAQIKTSFRSLAS